MPLGHISPRVVKPEAPRQAIFDGICRVMREKSSVPEDEHFMAITEHDAARTSAMEMFTLSPGVPMSFTFKSSCSTPAPLRGEGDVQEARGVLGEGSGIRPEDCS